MSVIAKRDKKSVFPQSIEQIENQTIPSHLLSFSLPFSRLVSVNSSPLSCTIPAAPSGPAPGAPRSPTS